MNVLASRGWEPKEAEVFRRKLLSWFAASRRDLPWRGVSDPYAVLVSEMMLQQTQVATVIAYYERWMERFPTVDALAAAPLEAVLEIWAGLGYYRRARFLHGAAQQIVERWEGSVPTTAKELRTLPGVGAYTAGAVASIAFGRPEPIVDGNVTRVLARLFCLDGDLSRGAGHRTLWELAADLVDPDRPGDFNQALMELGSTVCTPRSPACEGCPVSDSCKAFGADEVSRYPEALPRIKQRPVNLRCVIVVAGADCDDEPRRLLVVRRPDEGLLAGMWEFPCLEVSCPGDAADDAVIDMLEGYLGMRPNRERLHRLGSVVHQFSHLRWHVDAEALHLDAITAPGPTGRGDVRWVDEEELDVLPVSAAMRKIERLLGQASELALRPR